MHIFCVSNPISNVICHTIRLTNQISSAECIFLRTRAIHGTEGFRYIDIPPQTHWNAELIQSFYDFLSDICIKNNSKGFHAYVPHLYHDGHAILAFHERTLSISYVEEGAVAHGGMFSKVDTSIKSLDLTLINNLSSKNCDKESVDFPELSPHSSVIINSQKESGFPFFIKCEHYNSSFYVSNVAFRDHPNRVYMQPMKYIRSEHEDYISSMSLFYMPSLKFSDRLRFKGVDWISGVQSILHDENISQRNLHVKLHGDTPLTIVDEFKSTFPDSILYGEVAKKIGTSFYVDEASVLGWKSAIFAYRTSAIRYTKAFSPSTLIYFSNSIIE